MQQPPIVLPCKGVFETVTQKAHAVGIFELIDRCRIMPELADIEFHGMRVLVATVHQELFFLASRFEDRGRQFHVQHDRDHGREHEHNE